MVSTNAQTRTRAVTPVVLSGAVQWDMRSKASGRTYRIYVRAPTKSAPRAGHPVIYFTDGNITFPIAAMLAELFEVEPNCDAPLIVAIGYPVLHWAEEVGALRVMDLTSARPGERMFEEFFETRPEIAYGGSSAFYKFMTQELHPEIASMYRTDPGNRTLCGHSLGGLFVLDMLFRHERDFRTFVAGSPAIWWNGRATTLRDLETFRSRIQTTRAQPRVLITVGSMEQSSEGLPTPPHMTRERFEELINRQRWIDNARELASQLAAIQGPPGYRVEFHIGEGENHGSMISATVSRGLRFALSR